MARHPPFEKGNKTGYGGRRAGAGRKPDIVKQTMAEVLSTPLKGAKGRTLVQVAWDTMLTAMQDRDEDGCVTAPGVRAAEHVLNRQFGKPLQRLEMGGMTTEDLIKDCAMAAAAAKALTGE